MNQKEAGNILDGELIGTIVRWDRDRTAEVVALFLHPNPQPGDPLLWAIIAPENGKFKEKPVNDLFPLMEDSDETDNCNGGNSEFGAKEILKRKISNPSNGH